MSSGDREQERYYAFMRLKVAIRLYGGDKRYGGDTALWWRYGTMVAIWRCSNNALPIRELFVVSENNNKYETMGI